MISPHPDPISTNPASHRHPHVRAQCINGLIFVIFSTGCIPWLDAYNRRNFGFMYTFYGRFFFVLFCGSLCFGLKDPDNSSVVDGKPVYGNHWFGILTGVLSWTLSVFNVWALCNYPEYGADRGGVLRLTNNNNTGGDGGGFAKPPQQITMQEQQLGSSQQPLSTTEPAAPLVDEAAFGAAQDNPFA